MAENQAGPSTQGTSDLGSGEFMTEGVRVKLSLTNKGISWTSLTDRVSLEWNDIIRCHRGLTSSKTPLVAPEESDKDVCFTLHHCEKGASHIWRHTRRSFFICEGNLEDILCTIQEQSKKDRTRRMLVVINPNAGEGKGEEIYYSIVAPLFKLAEIQTDVIVSKNQNHPDEIGATYDFSTVDSIVTVGGDGTLQKVLHTWIPRVQREKGVDIDDHLAELHPLPCTVATIPTGTGNGLALGNYGCDDVTTAALNIISGRKVPRKLLRVTNGGKHVGFAAVILANGAWADVLEPYDKGRNKGFFGRQMTTIGTMCKKRREFNVRIEYLPIDTRKASRAKTSEDTNNQELRILEGLHTGIIAFPGLFIANRDTGKSSLDMVNPGVTMVLETQCGHLSYICYISKVIQLKNDMFYNDFTNAKKVMRYKYRLLHRQGEQRSDRGAQLDSLINCDGEMRLVHNINSDIEVSYFKDVLQMYGSVCIY